MSRLIWSAAQGVSKALRRALFYLMTRKRTRQGAREVCGIGWEWVGEERWRDARLSGEAAILCDPTWTEGYLLAGYSELRAGHPDEGRTFYERGLAIGPDDARLLGALGDLEKFTNRLPEAANAYRRALGFDPDNVQFQINLGIVLGGLGHRAEAVSLIADAARRTPGTRPLSDLLAETRVEGGDWEQALREVNDSLAIGESARMHYALALCLCHLGRLEEAFDHARRELHLDPTRDMNRVLVCAIAVELDKPRHEQEAAEQSSP